MAVVGVAEKPRKGWPRGRHRSEEVKKKISASLKGRQIPWIKGHHLTEEHKRKISISHTGKPLSKYHKRRLSIAHMGQIPWNKGKSTGPLSEEHKRKISLDCKGNEKICAARLKQVIPVKDTSIEVLMQNALRCRNIEFKKHIPLCGCQPDIVIEKEKVVIFCDGNYWHSKSFKNGKQWIKDRQQDKRLKENGGIVYRFWENEINSDVNKCLDKIRELRGCG